MATQGMLLWASQGVLVVKNLPASAGDIRNVDSVFESVRSPGEGHSNPVQLFLAWRILWTEEPGRLQSVSLQSRTWLKWLGMMLVIFIPASLI